MESERRALGAWADDPRVIVGICGARPARAEAEARRLAEAGCRALLSWGLAGGLDPDLKPGAVMTASSVICSDADPLPLTPVPGVGDPGPCFGAETVIETPAHKADLHRRLGAAFADMETHRVATVAAVHGIPAYVLRAVADPAERALPTLAAGALDETGRPRIGAVLAGLARQPWDLPLLLRVKRDADEGLDALSAVGRDLSRYFPELAG
ncbi:MAG: hypothetical protein OEN23_03240 [Paracoccaceae bacterium]|nr:hypothetical protein [Paracoccaceae bacterium]